MSVCQHTKTDAQNHEKTNQSNIHDLVIYKNHNGSWEKKSDWSKSKEAKNLQGLRKRRMSMVDNDEKNSLFFEIMLLTWWTPYYLKKIESSCSESWFVVRTWICKLKVAVKRHMCGCSLNKPQNNKTFIAQLLWCQGGKSPSLTSRTIDQLFLFSTSAFNSKRASITCKHWYVRA